MEVVELFDEVSCEEFYDEDTREFLEELRLYEANSELQVIADEQAEARVEVEYEFLYFGA